ncbi:hypothetical protein LINPERPRIM_LOCUS35514 [Linum perenne]
MAYRDPNNKCAFITNYGRLQLLISGAQVMLYHHATTVPIPSLSKPRNVVVHMSNVESGPAANPQPSGSNWRGWLVGVIMSLLLPLWRNQLWSLKKMEDKVEAVVETMEEVVETVEELAEKVEEVADEIGDRLPDGELKEMLEKIEVAADKAGKAAGLAHQVLDKVQAAEDQVESLIDGATVNKDQTKHSGSTTKV